MFKTTVEVSGMMCGMCEAHVNDAVRNALPVKKVTSSHTDKKTVILSAARLDEAKLREVIGETGYAVGGIVVTEEAEPKKFSLFKKKS